jgi:hypothetical protein
MGNEHMSISHTLKFGSWTATVSLGLLLWALIQSPAWAASYSYQLSDGTLVTLSVGDQTVVTLTGQPNSVYQIDATEDLAQWVTLVPQANLGAAGTFTHIDTRGLSKCFYRIVVQGQCLQQNQSSGGGYKMDVKLAQKGAQSFRNGVTGGPNYFITRLVLHLSRESQAPNANLNVSIGTGTNSGAIAASSVSIAPGQITNTSAGLTFMTFHIVYPTAVGPFTAGTTYYVNLECEASNSKPVYVEYSGADVYSGGTYYKSGINDAKDMWFELWGF